MLHRTAAHILKLQPLVIIYIFNFSRFWLQSQVNFHVGSQLICPIAELYASHACLADRGFGTAEAAKIFETESTSPNLTCYRKVFQLWAKGQKVWKKWDSRYRYLKCARRWWVGIVRNRKILLKVSVSKRCAFLDTQDKIQRLGRIYFVWITWWFEDRLAIEHLHDPSSLARKFCLYHVLSIEHCLFVPAIIISGNILFFAFLTIHWPAKLSLSHAQTLCCYRY